MGAVPLRIPRLPRPTAWEHRHLQGCHRAIAVPIADASGSRGSGPQKTSSTASSSLGNLFQAALVLGSAVLYAIGVLVFRNREWPYSASNCAILAPATGVQSSSQRYRIHVRDSGSDRGRGVMLLCLIISGVLTQVAAFAGRNRLVYADTAESGDPPQVASGSPWALPRRLCQLPWIRGNKLKEEGKYYGPSISRAASRTPAPLPSRLGLPRLEPLLQHLVATPTPQERWSWVQRNQPPQGGGIPANPNDRSSTRTRRIFIQGQGVWRRPTTTTSILHAEWTVVLGPHPSEPATTSPPRVGPCLRHGSSAGRAKTPSARSTKCSRRSKLVSGSRRGRMGPHSPSLTPQTPAPASGSSNQRELRPRPGESLGLGSAPANTAALELSATRFRPAWAHLPLGPQTALLDKYRMGPSR